MEAYVPFVKYQYQMKIITAEDVQSFVPEFLTQEEANSILNKNLKN